jgi:hypothetical protein
MCEKEDIEGKTISLKKGVFGCICSKMDKGSKAVGKPTGKMGSLAGIGCGFGK